MTRKKTKKTDKSTNNLLYVKKKTTNSRFSKRILLRLKKWLDRKEFYLD